MKLRLLPAWLALDRSTRRAKGERLWAIAARYRDDVTIRWYDADALAGEHTDWLLCEFDSLDRYHALWEELRDDELFHHPYAEIVDVALGLADGYERFEAGAL